MSKRNNSSNLIPMSERSPDFRKASGRKGGLNAAKARRERKAMSDILRLMIDQPVDKRNDSILNALKKVGITSEEATNGALINLQLMNLALSSSVDEKTKLRAIELIHKFLDGQKVDVTTNGRDVVQKPFVIEVIDSREQVNNEQENDEEESQS